MRNYRRSFNSMVSVIRRTASWKLVTGTVVFVGLLMILTFLPGPTTGRNVAFVRTSIPSTPDWPSTTLPAIVPSTTTTTVQPAPLPTPPPAQTIVTAPPITTSGSGDCGPPYDPTDGTGVTCAQFLAWSQVATCEEGGWVGASGSAYPDSLGVTASNWWGNGGTSDVSPNAQIVVAERIQSNPPDQGGCGGW